SLAFPALHALAQERKFAGKTVRILTWSDDTGLAVLRNIAQTFEAQTGARVIADRTGSTSEMVAKLKAAGSRAQYDVITLADARDTIVAAPRLSGGGASNAEAGFKRLAELKDRVLTFGENPTQIAQLFRSNALDIGGVYAPAFFAKDLKDPGSGMGATYNLKE